MEDEPWYVLAIRQGYSIGLAALAGWHMTIPRGCIVFRVSEHYIIPCIIIITCLI